MARKITKATLDELEKEMAPLTEQEQQAHLGGTGYDPKKRESGTLGWQDLQKVGAKFFAVK